MKSSEKKITFEQYLQFYQFSWLSNISRFSLNQIIEMHGFVKLHLERKHRLRECLEAIDLMEPARSTLEDSVSSRAFLSGDEIVNDLEEIGWREGRLLVRSIKTLESDAERELIVADGDLPFATSARARRDRRRRVPPAEFVIVGKRPRSRRKRASVNALMSATAAAAAAVVGSSV